MSVFPEKAAAGILPIFQNKVYLIKSSSKKPQDFGGKLSFLEARALISRTNASDKEKIKYDAACRKSLEEGGFGKESIVEVIRTFNNPTCKYTMFLCKLNKKPVPTKRGTVIIEKCLGTPWNATDNFHFRVASTPGLCRFLANYGVGPEVVVRTFTPEELNFLDA